MKKIKVCSRH